jgi:triphosphatase
MQHAAMSEDEPLDDDGDAAPLSKQMSVADAFAQIAASCLNDFRRAAPAILSRRDPEDVHDSRIAIRRLRAAFSIFKPALRDPEFETLSIELRELARALGEVRDLDVVLEHVKARALRIELTAMGATARKRLVDLLFSKRMDDTLRRLENWSVSGGWRNAPRGDFDVSQPIEGFATDVLERRFKRLKKRGRHFSAMPEDERHRFRILVKKLRYGAEFFGPLYGRHKKLRRFLRRMTKLQDHLGYLNDAKTAERILAPLVADPGAIRHPKREKKEIVRAEEALGDLLSLKPFWR